jgi:hypothetical protein
MFHGQVCLKCDPPVLDLTSALEILRNSLLSCLVSRGKRLGLFRSLFLAQSYKLWHIRNKLITKAKLINHGHVWWHGPILGLPEGRLRGFADELQARFGELFRCS